MRALRHKRSAENQENVNLRSQILSEEEGRKVFQVIENGSKSQFIEGDTKITVVMFLET